MKGKKDSPWAKERDKNIKGSPELPEPTFYNKVHTPPTPARIEARYAVLMARLQAGKSVRDLVMKHPNGGKSTPHT